jgi:5-methylcytosine-specific restriction protein A
MRRVPEVDLHFLLAAINQLQPEARPIFIARLDAALQIVPDFGPGDFDRALRIALAGLWSPPPDGIERTAPRPGQRPSKLQEGRHEKVAARAARMVCKRREQKEAFMYYARSERLYSTARWQRIRKYQLMEHPLCKYCAERGLVTPATVCDHVEPHRGDVGKFWCGPFQSLCKPCHDSAKRFVEERGYRPDVGLDGWPLDPNHPANRAR